MSAERKLRQFRLLLWKNFLIQKRKVVTTIFEIGLPAFFALILIFIRLRVSGEMKDKQVWDPCLGWQRIPYQIKATRLAFSPQNNVTQKIMEHVLRSEIGLKGIIFFTYCIKIVIKLLIYTYNCIQYI